MCNKFILFELWHDCDHHCSFCHYNGSKSIDKLLSLSFIQKKLCEPEVDLNNEIGLIGGEIFDSQLDVQRVSQEFYKIVEIISEKIISGKTRKFYIATSLLYEDISKLDCFCKFVLLHGIQEKTLICTSYDVLGRFRSEAESNLWDKNIRFLKTNYPDIKVHVEMIVSGLFIESVLDKSFSIREFQRKYDVRVDYISPHVIIFNKDIKYQQSKKDCNETIGYFFPKRKLFIDFCKFSFFEDQSIDLKSFLDSSLRSNTIYMIMNQRHLYVTGRNNDMEKSIREFCEANGHQYLNGYIDSDRTLEEDVMELALIYGQ